MQRTMDRIALREQKGKLTAGSQKCAIPGTPYQCDRDHEKPEWRWAPRLDLRVLGTGAGRHGVVHGSNNQCDVDRGAARNAMGTRRGLSIAQSDGSHREQFVDSDLTIAVAVASTRLWRGCW